MLDPLTLIVHVNLVAPFPSRSIFVPAFKSGQHLSPA